MSSMFNPPYPGLTLRNDFSKSKKCFESFGESRTGVLFSKNRLNVAIYRAKCLAILIASPQLFSVQCRTPEEIALVNTLWWLWEEYRFLPDT